MEWTDELTPDQRARVLAAIIQQQGRAITREATHYDSQSREDFLQDLAATILASPPDMLLPEAGQPVDRWLTAVMRNKRRDAYRAENRHRRILRQAHGQPGHRLSDRPGESAERTVMRRMEHAEVLRRIGRLPGHLRDAALLRYNGYSYTEIGQALGICDVAARKRIMKIRSAKIRRLLD